MKHTIFLTGHRKSGTTLLKSLLDGQPEISSYPTDLTLLYAYFPHVKFKKYPKKMLVEKIIKIVMGSLKIVNEYTKYTKKELKNFRILLKKNLVSKNLVVEKQVIQTVLKCWKNFFKEKENHFFLIKETTQSMNYKILKKIFPKLKIIQIIRDPRDNYSSLKSGFRKYYKKIGYNNEELLLSAIFRIKNDLKFAQLLQKKNFYLCLKFEDLVQNPKKEIKKIFRFLNIKENNIQIKPTISNQNFYGNNFTKKISGISKKNVYRWKKRITKIEESFINFYLEEEIKFWKYSLPKKNNFHNVNRIYNKINSKLFFKGHK